MNTYTPAQAAAVTGLPLKSVQKAIDSRVVPYRVIRRGGVSTRCLLDAALICLRLEAHGLKQLRLEFRREVFRTVIRAPRPAPTPVFGRGSRGCCQGAKGTRDGTE